MNLGVAPHLEDEFGLGITQIGLVLTILMGTYAIGSPIMGALVNKTGKIPQILLGNDIAKSKICIYVLILVSLFLDFASLRFEV